VDSTKNFVPYYLEKAVRYLKKQVIVSDNSGSYSALGSTYFRLNRLDSAEHFYEQALLKDTNEPINFFNLAELQTIRLKPDDALRTLEDANSRFKKGRSSDEGSYFSALYYFYTMENKAIKGIDFSSDEKLLNQLITSNSDGSLIFSDWSFRTFYRWARNLNGVSAETKSNVLKNLCFAIAYSKDKDTPCVTNL
jgi:tetratricopeptide (TPR) repeat protein